MSIIAWRPLFLGVFFLLMLPIGTMIHELGHGIMALACGAERFSITLIDFGFNGGYCEWFAPHLNSVALFQVRIAGGLYATIFYLVLTVVTSRWFTLTAIGSLLYAVIEACTLESYPLFLVLGTVTGWLGILPFAIFLTKSVLEGDLNEDQA